ncbi:nSTAND3 domain-containing NTPase [Streptomyces lancefieldiae]|uniref:Restriction endonuclease n=1 Tax=Streptomyces lancefieldiae TaxID=3075520 RepID=A0ABU3AUU2_9ACTN|nr:restriction endonuclease [Streptomyces sp. DSM 40712]MDT0613620.1 restriction endonuclease [Streptomyces sp. DSM 40712]
MDSFELGRLTDHDFEVVCRDLFSDVLGIPLEIFPRGRDRGIDLRHTGPSGTTVVQCKHWPRATQATLIRRLIKDELPKVRALAPDRYIVATTVGLTVDGKEELCGAFAPYVRDTGDLYGVDEIVAELLRRPELVRRHFRLWLSSTSVLQTVLNQDRYLRSSWLQKRLPGIADTFVPHEGFERAKQLLDTQQVCVIAGIPGVGKTTVALMLAAWLMGNNYEVHEISQDVDEIGTLWRDGTRQVFLYDDFLGSTTLDTPLNKNEDNRLLSVIREIQETPGKALVMTTRDYLLEHARLRHDRLAEPDVSDAVSVIRLTDLDLQVRGQILYNHVHHSSLPPNDKRRFADPAVWRPVAQHRNFNPRLVEETLRLSARRGQDVGAAMLENLDNPRRVWERIVENELSDEAVHMLEVLFTFRSAPLEDLEESWHWYRKEMDQAADGRTFRRALQLLDGTMITIEQGRVAFHNPSIEDYVRFHLNAGRAHFLELIRAIVRGEQLRRLVKAARMADGAGILARLREHELAVTAAAHQMEDDLEMGLFDEDESLSTHLEWALGAAELLDSASLAAYVTKETLPSFTHFSSISDLVSLANSLSASPLVPQEHAERFVEELTDRIQAELLESAEVGDWYRSSTLYDQLQSIPSASDREPVTPVLVRCALQELRRLAAEPEQEPHAANLELMTELLDFLWEQEAEDELPEEFAVVQDRAERVRTARDAERNERLLQYQAQREPAERSDKARDRALVTELMRKLEDRP